MYIHTNISKIVYIYISTIFEVDILFLPHLKKSDHIDRYDTPLYNSTTEETETVGSL